jgi:Secretion system C-terminal sorting domain
VVKGGRLAKPHPSANTIEVFPNPAHDRIKIQLSQDLIGVPQIMNSKLIVNLLDGQGKLLTTEQFNDVQATNVFNLPEKLPAGIYILHINFGNYDEKKIISIQ